MLLSALSWLLNLVHVRETCSLPRSLDSVEGGNDVIRTIRFNTYNDS